MPKHDGATPAFIAAQEGHVAVLTELRRLGADLTTPLNDGATPAFIAAEKGHVAVLTELHRLGIDLTTPRHDGLTPLDIAEEYGHVAVVAELRRLSKISSGGGVISGSTFFKPHYPSTDSFGPGTGFSL